MNNQLILKSSPQNIFLLNNPSWIRELFLVVTSVIFLALASHLSIPIGPVPLTFQSAGVILIGMSLGARLSFYSITAYLILGFLGAPVFSLIESDHTFILGPTVGYLIGFLFAAPLSGYLAQKGWASGALKSFAAAFLGTTIIFIFGLTWLSTFIGWHKAIMIGFMPFIVTEPAKLFLESLFVPKLWKKGYGN